VNLIYSFARKLALFFAILILDSTVSYSQSNFEPGKMRIDGVDYEIIVTNGSIIGVGSMDSKYAEGYPGPLIKDPLPVLRSDIHVNFDNVKRIVQEILKDKLPQLRENKEKLGIRVWFEQNGRIEGGFFATMNKNTLIRPREIHEIYLRIKNEIHATFTGQDYKNYILIPYKYPVIQF